MLANMIFHVIVGDADAVLANPLQMAVIALGLYGGYILYTGYMRLLALFDDEWAEIDRRLGDLTGWKRRMRAYQMMNPLYRTRIFERIRRRPEARRRMYLGAAILIAAVVAWHYVH